MEKKHANKIDLNLDEFSVEVVELLPGLVSISTHDRKSARQKLEKIGLNVLPEIHKLLRTKDKQLRWEAAKVLETLGSSSSINTFISLLQDENSDIRWIASEGLIRVGRDSIVPLLQEAIEKGDSVFVLNGAHHVLKHLFTKEENKQFKELLHTLKSTNETALVAPVKAMEALEFFRKTK
jgi:HEAT repeat protein